MTPVGQCAQFFFDVGVIGQAAFASPVVVPGGFGSQIPDLRSQRAHEFVYFAAGELLGFDEVSSDLGELATQVNQQMEQFIAALVRECLSELGLGLCPCLPRRVQGLIVIFPLVFFLITK